MSIDIDWLKNAVIYHILIDRFSRGKEKDILPIECKEPIFYGGNIKGIIERLDYLNELGINTVWLSPFNSTSAYHGYHVTDFFNVDPHFGDIETLKKLIQTFHKKRVKIIMDFVPNHVSSQHPYFLDAQKNKSSKYKNWFYFTKWPDKYLCFLSFYELAKLNLDYTPARDYIISAAKFWLNLGIDGFRLDHVIGPKHSFWQYFKKSIKKDFPNTVLIGEAWLECIKFKELNTINMRRKFFKLLLFKLSLGRLSDGLLKEYIDELDGVLDFRFQKLTRLFIAKKNFFRPLWLLKIKLKRHYNKFPKDYFLLSFLDNHDMNRFLYDNCQNKKRLKEAAQIQFKQKQPAVIYYGTEVGLTQQKSIKACVEDGDLETRGMMPWINQDVELLTFYKNLIKNKNHATHELGYL